MIFAVKAPIPGFEHIKEVQLEKIDDFFYKCVSKTDTTVFTLINPFMIRPYEIEIPDFFKETLGIGDKPNIAILNMMIVATPIETSTINFIAPLIFNVDNATVAQVVLDVNKHPNLGLMESISNYLNKEEK